MFHDGTILQPQSSGKYLGCTLHYNVNASAEVAKRIQECMAILKRLDIFWLHCDCSKRLKLQVFNAVIRSKLLYGLESLQIIDHILTKKRDIPTQRFTKDT